jgi:hypothetical protein
VEKVFHGVIQSDAALIPLSGTDEVYSQGHLVLILLFSRTFSGTVNEPTWA